jgi:hypothetical protein
MSSLRNAVLHLFMISIPTRTKLSSVNCKNFQGNFFNNIELDILKGNCNIILLILFSIATAMLS